MTRTVYGEIVYRNYDDKNQAMRKCRTYTGKWWQFWKYEDEWITVNHQ